MFKLIHTEFKIQEIFPSRLANLINISYALICLSDLQTSREMFSVF